VTTLWQVTGQPDRGRQANGWADPIIDVGREGCASSSSLELGVLLKDRWSKEIEYFMKNKLYEDRLAEFKHNRKESGLRRMYRKFGRVGPGATLLS
jgi:hypothetical protein